MNLNDLFTEEKVRLDPKCWTGKKIGNPKTKMKGGTRVNNCVPAESVNEMDKSQTPPGRDGSNDSDAGKKEYTAKATTPKKVAKHGEKILNKVLNKKQGMAEGYQLDEGAVETITALVKKIPGIGKYYQLAQQYKPQLIQILKTSKSGKEVKQKMEQLVAQQPAPVAESGLLKQLGGLAVGGGSILSTIWMNAMGMIDGVLAHATAGEIGGAVASGSILGLIPVTLMLFAAMLLFKGSKQSSDEKAQAVQAQRGQQGMAEGEGEYPPMPDRYYGDAKEPMGSDDNYDDEMAEGDNMSTFEQAECNHTMEGEYCPEHGLAECGNYGMYESELARIKSLALFK